MKNRTLFLKTIVLVSLFSLKDSSAFNGKSRERNNAQHVVTKLFGDKGIQSNASHQTELEELFHNLLLTTSFQKREISRALVHLLENEIATLKEKISQSSSPNPTLEHSLFIAQVQKNHLQEYATSLKSSLGIKEKIVGTVQQWYCNIVSFFYRILRKPHLSFIETVTKQVDYYIHFEQDHIFEDYKKTLYFFSKQKRVALPEILRFWTDPADCHNLLTGTKAHSEPLKVQMALAEEVAETAGTDALIGIEGEVAEDVAAAATANAAQTAGTDTATVAENAQGVMNTELGEDGAASLQVDGDRVAEDELGEEIGDESSSASSGSEDDPKQTKAEKKAARQAKRQAEIEKLAEKRQAVLDNPATSSFKKKWVTMRMKVTNFIENSAGGKLINAIEDNVTGPFADWLNESALFKTLNSFGDNALSQGLNKLPGWLKGIVDMSLQMAIMQGGTLVEFWASQDAQQEFLTFANINGKLTEFNTIFGTKFKIQLTKKIKSGYQDFTQSQTTLTQSQKNALLLLQYKQTYTQEAFLNTPPQTYFTIQPNSQPVQSGVFAETTMESDQRFALSAMLTPDTINNTAPLSTAWRNLFRSGMWIFRSDSNGFYQTQQVPLTGTPKDQATQALYNTIARDYIPTSNAPYTITVECTLLSASYPFFVGIIFNNARWISGVPDRFHQHRFAGLYGQKAGAIYSVLEESIITPPQASQAGDPSTQWPVYQILKNPTNYTNNPVTVAQFPQTFRFTITTQPNTAGCVITTPQSSQTTTPLATLTKANVSSSVFLFHGIGFMAAGCRAQFTIINPKELTYSSDQIAQFKKFIAS